MPGDNTADDLDVLIRTLKSSSSSERARAAEAICRSAERAAPAAVALIDVLADEDESVVQWSTAALEEMGTPPAAMVGELAVRLARESPGADYDTVYWAATLLGRLGAEASDAAPQLAALLSDVSRPLNARQRAAWALGRIGPAAASALPQLRAAAAGTDVRLARLARSAIDAIEHPSARTAGR